MKIAKLIGALGMSLALAACGSAGEEAKGDVAAEPASEDVAAAAESAEPANASAETVAEDDADVTDETAAAAAPAPAAAQVASSGPPDSYLICSSCHAVEPGKNGIGPTLAGVYGAKAGAVPGFSYSDALKKANITWTDAALDKWLEAPMKMVPGTRMVFGGIPDPAKRKELIAYMKSL